MATASCAPSETSEVVEKPSQPTDKTDWIKAPALKIDVDDFVAKAKDCTDFVTETGVMIQLPRLEEFQKKTILMFVVDRKSKKLIRSSKETVAKLIATTGVRAERIVKCKGYNTWNSLFKTEEVCIELSKKEIITKEYILRMEYMGRRRTTISVFEVPAVVPGEYLGAFLLKFGEITAITVDKFNGTWSFDVWLNESAFKKVPYYIEANGEKLPVVVAGRRPACWICNEVGHLTFTCPTRIKPAQPNPKNRVLEHLTPKAAADKKTSSSKPTAETVTPEEFEDLCNTENESPKKKVVWNIVTGKKSPKSYAQVMTEEEQLEIETSNDPGGEKYKEILNLKKSLDEERKTEEKKGKKKRGKKKGCRYYY